MMLQSHGKKQQKEELKSYMQPTVEKDEFGFVVRSGIHTYGDTVHVFVERKNYDGVFLPGFIKWESDYNPESTGLKYIDHMVGNVGWNEMNKWVKFYEDVMGFVNFCHLMTNKLLLNTLH